MCCIRRRGYRAAITGLTVPELSKRIAANLETTGVILAEMEQLGQAVDDLEGRWVLTPPARCSARRHSTDWPRSTITPRPSSCVNVWAEGAQICLLVPGMGAENSGPGTVAA